MVEVVYSSGGSAAVNAAARRKGRGVAAYLWALYVTALIGISLGLAPPAMADVPVYQTVEMRLGQGFAHVDWAPDGRYMAAAQQEFIRIYDMWDGSLVREIPDHGACVRCVIYSPTDGMLFSVGDDKTLRKWNPHTGEELARRTLDYPGLQLAISSSGAMLAVGQDETRLSVIRTDDLATIWEQADGYYSGYGMSWSPSGKYLLASLGSRVFDAADGTVIPIANPNDRPFYSFGASDDTLLAHNGIQYNYHTGQAVWQAEDMPNSSGKITMVHHPLRPLITWDGLELDGLKCYYALCVYDTSRTQVLHLATLPTADPIGQFGLSADGTMLHAFTNSGDLYTFSTADWRLLRHQSYCDVGFYPQLGWSEDGNRLYSLGSEGKLVVYSTRTGEREWYGSLAAPYSHDQTSYFEFTSATQLPDDRLVFGSLTGYLWYFNLRTLDPPTSESTHGYAIRSIASSPSGHQLAAGGYTAANSQERLMLWEPGDFKQARLVNQKVIGLVYRNEARLLVDSGFSSIYEYNTATASVLRSTHASANYTPRHRLALNPTRERLIAATSVDLTTYDLANPAFSAIFSRNLWPDGTAYFGQGILDIKQIPGLSAYAMVVDAVDSFPRVRKQPEVSVIDDRLDLVACYDDPGASPAATAVTLSPDGSRLAAATSMGIYIFRVHGAGAGDAWACYE